MSVILDLWFGHALKVKQLPLLLWWKPTASRLPEYIYNWTATALMFRLTDKSIGYWNPVWDGVCIPGSLAPAGKSCQEWLHPRIHCAGCFLAVAILSIYVTSDFWKKKKKSPPSFLTSAEIFWLNAFPLKLHHLDFKLISLTVPRNMMTLMYNALRGCIILGIQLSKHRHKQAKKDNTVTQKRSQN